MPHSYTLSRKILHSVRDSIERLKSPYFDERDVKALLVDLRELAKYLKNRLPGETTPFTHMNTEFIDVCDFIAHASRDRGVVERNVRQHARLLYSKLETATVEEFTAVPVEGVLNADALVTAMLGIAFLGLSSCDKSITAEFFSDIYKRKDEVALCILSLLQDLIIDLKEEEGFAFLHLMPHEGFYRLYCRVINSRIERESRARTGGSGRMSLNFPVAFSSAKCIDDLPDCATAELPPIFETYRDEQMVLRVRAVSVRHDRRTVSDTALVPAKVLDF